MANRLLTIFKVSRPVAWCFAPILFGIGVIHSRLIPKPVWPMLRAGLQVFAFSFPLCTIVFGVNDVYDYESDLRNPRKTADGLEGTVLHPAYHADALKTAYASTAFVVASALVNRTPQNIAATALLVFLSWQYSSPPFRFKEIPILDSISNGCIVFLAWFAGFSFSGRSIADAPGKGYMLSLCTAGVHALAAVVDVEADVAAGQTTIAAFLGKRLAALFAVACFFIALTTVEIKSTFGVYICGGLLLMFSACVNIHWAHRVFQAVIYWSLFMSAVWFGVQAWKGIAKAFVKQD